MRFRRCLAPAAWGRSIAREQTFWIYDMTSKETRQLADFDMPGTRTFDITPDGTRIVFDRIRENSDIVLIDLPDSGRQD
jgi:hypothetical protein